MPFFFNHPIQIYGAISDRLMRLILFFSIFISCQLFYANEMDSLHLLLQNAEIANNLSRQLELSVNIGKIEYKQGNYGNALTLYKSAFAIAEKTKSQKHCSDALNDIGNTHLKLFNFSEAIETFSDLIQRLKSKDGGDLAGAYSNLARAYRGLGNNELAYEFQHTGLQLYEEADDSIGIARSLYYIGNILFYQSNYEMALEYYQRTLGICQRIKSEKRIFSCLSAIGSTFNRLGQLDKSLEYNRRALELALELDHQSGLAYAYLNVGSDHYALKQFEEALNYLYKSLEIHRNVKNKWGEIGSLRFLGEVLMEQGDFKKSHEFLKAAHELATITNSRPRQLETNRALAEYYNKKKDFKQANFYLQNYADLKDSLANEMTIQKMASSKFSYEISKKEKALLDKEEEIERSQRNFLLSGVAVLFILIWMLFSRYKTHAKNNKILEEKNQQILSQNQQLEQSNIELKRFAYIASHDLKEPLRSIGSYANLLQRRYKGKIDQNADEYLEFITDSTKRLYSLLNDVLNFSKLEFDQKNSDEVNVNYLLNTIKEDLSLTIQERNASVEFGNMPTVHIKDTHLQQLFKNLISNSIKYSNGNRPSVTIGCEQKKGHYLFSIRDNGIGIEPAYHQKIFDMFQRLHIRGDYEGNGIGLAICKKIVEQYNGKIWVNSEVGKGSTFYFTLPDVER